MPKLLKRPAVRLAASLMAGLAALSLVALLALELALSGPTGMSGYLIYRTARTFIRDASIPSVPRIDGFSNAGPNVVILLLDCYRRSYLEDASPNLAAFGQQAWRFDRYYSAAPWTKPSTASLFTGLSVRKHYVMKGGGSKLPPEAVTLAERMQQLGFQTAGFVWNPHLTRRQSFDQGFDVYVDDAARGSKALLYEFFSWVERERPQRFFSYVHFLGTHDPYYDDNDLGAILSAPSYEGDLGFHDGDYKVEVFDGRRLTPEENAHLEHVAEGMARKVDREAVGEFLVRFDASGLPENTLLVITSDHGDAFSEHGLVSHSHTVYDEEVHVPLLVHFPERFARERGFPATGRDACPATTVDLVPTVLDFVGAEAPSGLDGVSLVPSGRTDPSCPRPIVSEMALQTGGIPEAALVWKDQKLIVDYDKGETRLYDLRADPDESRDLAAQRASDVARLEAELSRRTNADGSSMAQWEQVDGVLPEEHTEALRALGYVE